MTIDKYLAETIVTSFKDIDRVCSAIDGYMENFALSFSCGDSEFLYKSLTELIIRKNKLLRFKDKVLSCVNLLKTKDRQIFEALTKLKHLKKEDICFLLNIEERTFYRRIERMYLNLASLLEEKNQDNLLLSTCEEEYFIYSKYEGIKNRRQSYSRGIFEAHQREGLYE